MTIEPIAYIHLSDNLHHHPKYLSIVGPCCFLTLRFPCKLTKSNLSHSKHAIGFSITQLNLAAIWVFPKIGVPQFLDGFFKMEHPKKTMDDLGGKVSTHLFFGNIQNLAAFFPGGIPVHKTASELSLSGGKACHHAAEQLRASQVHEGRKMWRRKIYRQQKNWDDQISSDLGSIWF